MASMKIAFVILAAFALGANAKPSHPYGFHGIPDHLDFAPPVLPPAHFHGETHVLPEPGPHAHFLPAPGGPAFLPQHHLHAAQYLPAPAPLLPAPAAFLPPTDVHFAPAPIAVPAPVFPAVHAHATLLPPPPAPVVHTNTHHLIPAPYPVPVPVGVPVAAPSYRAIPGPKTTTHHVSIGYAFPAPLHAHLHAAPHAAHLRAAPLLAHKHHHHHHTLF